jgi:hypothetical protein
MKTKGNAEVFVERIKSGDTLQRALEASGRSPKQARKGMAVVSAAMLKMLAKEGIKLAEFGKSLSTETLKNLAIGRLAKNAIDGSDKGVMSAKTLGSHKDINLWAVDSQVGVIVLGMPGQIEAKREKLLEAIEPEK